MDALRPLDQVAGDALGIERLGVSLRSFLALLVRIKGKAHATHTGGADERFMMRRPAARAVAGNDVLLSRAPQREGIEDGLGDDEIVGINPRRLTIPNRTMRPGKIKMDHARLVRDIAPIQPARLAVLVEDGHDDTLIKLLVALVVDEAAFLRRRKLRRAQLLLQRAIHIAQLEVREHVHVAQPALFEVVQPTLAAPQQALVIMRYHCRKKLAVFERITQHAARFDLAAASHAWELRQQLQSRFLFRAALTLRHELQHVAARAAGRAVPELLGRCDVQRRLRVIMERAPPDEVGSCLLQRHAVAFNDLHKIGLGLDGVEVGAWAACRVHRVAGLAKKLSSLVAKKFAVFISRRIA